MTGWARRPWSIALGLLAGALIAAMLVGTFGESVPARFEAASIELALPLTRSTRKEIATPFRRP